MRKSEIHDLTGKCLKDVTGDSFLRQMELADSEAKARNEDLVLVEITWSSAYPAARDTNVIYRAFR